MTLRLYKASGCSREPVNKWKLDLDEKTNQSRKNSRYKRRSL